MKTAITTITLFILSVTFTCAQKDNKVLTYGKTTDHGYSNDFFGLSFSFDKNWFVKSREELQAMANTGKAIIKSQNAKLDDEIDFSLQRTAFLFSVSEYKLGAMVDFNPSFVLITETLKNTTTIKSAQDYLSNTKSGLKRTSSQYVFEDNFSQLNSFTVMKLKVNSQGGDIGQWYLSKIIDGYVLSCVITFNAEEQKKLLATIINSIKFQ